VGLYNTHCAEAGIRLGARIKEARWCKTAVYSCSFTGSKQPCEMLPALLHICTCHACSLLLLFSYLNVPGNFKTEINGERRRV
jgi:hypothetical protein